GLARHGGAPRRRLKPGTVLVRDYQGQRHTVTVVSDGFDWQGATYPSLPPSQRRHRVRSQRLALSMRSGARLRL
ncbi:MAG: DUF2924 domain-containing protein, partial [Hyphomicrobiales bacterium]|nr:DUF2924 domain-containing protein [Hyphomicrobiales bacterium]